jgi:hypothetical protein
MASNYLSKSGFEWMKNMRKYQGGIYVSQWMVFDNKMFQKRMGAEKSIRENKEGEK